MSSFFRRFISFREEPGIRLIVFDFDGTIADTRELVLKIISKHLISFQIKLTKNIIKRLGDKPLKDYLVFTGVPVDFASSVASTIQENYYKEYHKIRPCKNLMAIKSINVKKVIVSNNVTFFIEKALHSLRANFFEGVYGADKFKNKVSMIKALAKKHKLDADEIIYVGDKAIDVRVAREIGCYSVIISNKSSWSSRKDVVLERPDYLLTNLGKLPLVVSNINMKQLSAV